MGSVPHHQAQARRFLALARADCDAGDFPRAANALARAASHAATAALVHTNFTSRPTRRRLTNSLFALAARGQIPFGVVRTFRHVYELPAQLPDADCRAAQLLLRRARRRVAALVRAVARAVAGRPQAAVRRRYTAFVSAPHPVPTSFSDILALPNFKTIAADHGLTGVPLVKRPDPHGFYQRGITPRPCPCHPEPLDDLSEPTGDLPLPLSPLWQKALSHTFRCNIPDALPYR